jgi:hypothetical protein
MPRACDVAVLLGVLILLIGCPGQGPAVDDDDGIGDDDTVVVDDDDSAETHAVVSGISAALIPDIVTVVVVSWDQGDDVDQAWLEFTFENDEWSSSPAVPRAAGAHSEVILGVPEQTEVRFKVVVELGGERIESDEHVAVTGTIPPHLPAPSLVAWDPALTSSEPWILGTADGEPPDPYAGPFTVFILDRQARVVWYWEQPPGVTSMAARVSRDGTHIVVDEGTYYMFDETESVIRRMTLDLGTFEGLVAPDLVFAYDEIDDGSFVYESLDADERYTLRQLFADGSTQELWDCLDWYPAEIEVIWQCATNALVWRPETDSVTWSFFTDDTVIEIERPTGAVLRQWGSLPGSWAFDPPEAGFNLQHYPNYTPDGTLIVSTHLFGDSKQQRAFEYAVDDSSETLVELWSYGEGVDAFAEQQGEAVRLANGNTLINYGTQGHMREVTLAGEVAWDAALGENYMLGHTSLVEDLYAINRGADGVRR